MWNPMWLNMFMRLRVEFCWRNFNHPFDVQQHFVKLGRRCFEVITKGEDSIRLVWRDPSQKPRQDGREIPNFQNNVSFCIIKQMLLCLILSNEDLYYRIIPFENILGFLSYFYTDFWICKISILLCNPSYPWKCKDSAKCEQTVWYHHNKMVKTGKSYDVLWIVTLTVETCSII